MYSTSPSRCRLPRAGNSARASSEGQLWWGHLPRQGLNRHSAASTLRPLTSDGPAPSANGGRPLRGAPPGLLPLSLGVAGIRGASRDRSPTVSGTTAGAVLPVSAAELEHVPVKDVVVGEALFVEQVTEELSQVTIKRKIRKKHSFLNKQVSKFC